MNKQFSRIVGLINEDNFAKIQSKTITVIGLGGVGGTALEALVRTGFRKFNLIDFDNVDISNLNRQILYTQEDVGKKKVDAAKNRIISINKDVEVSIFATKVSKDLLDNIQNDFIVDAIDDIPSKVMIAKYALDNNIPFIVSLGMANKMDPSKVICTKINKTTVDPLARKLRYEYKNSGIDLNKVNCVFSSEEVKVKGNSLFSCISVTSSAGLAINSYLLNYYCNN